MTAARRIVTDNVALGSAGTVKRRRVEDNLDALHLDEPHRRAAIILRTAWEHCYAGKGLGPMPWGRDIGNAAGALSCPQERAITAATALRIGCDALGHHARDHGIIPWVVLAGLGLREYERHMRWAHGAARLALVDALERLSLAYGT